MDKEFGKGKSTLHHSIESAGLHESAGKCYPIRVASFVRKCWRRAGSVTGASFAETDFQTSGRYVHQIRWRYHRVQQQFQVMSGQYKRVVTTAYRQEKLFRFVQVLYNNKIEKSTLFAWSVREGDIVEFRYNHSGTPGSITFDNCCKRKTRSWGREEHVDCSRCGEQKVSNF